MFLTHLDGQGHDESGDPIENADRVNRAVNIPEFRVEDVSVRRTSAISTFPPWMSTAASAGIGVDWPAEF